MTYMRLCLVHTHTVIFTIYVHIMWKLMYNTCSSGTTNRLETWKTLNNRLGDSSKGWRSQLSTWRSGPEPCLQYRDQTGTPSCQMPPLAVCSAWQGPGAMLHNRTCYCFWSSEWPAHGDTEACSPLNAEDTLLYCGKTKDNQEYLASRDRVVALLLRMCPGVNSQLLYGI
jgi:hypothetical protein